MAKKPRLGTDPLDWIGDTRGKMDKQGLQSKPKERRSVERGLPEGWTRATFIVRHDHLEKLRALSYWDRRPIKELLEEVFGDYFKGKKVKPLPEEVKKK